MQHPKTSDECKTILNNIEPVQGLYQTRVIELLEIIVGIIPIKDPDYIIEINTRVRPINWHNDNLWRIIRTDKNVYTLHQGTVDRRWENLSVKDLIAILSQRNSYISYIGRTSTSQNFIYYQNHKGKSAELRVESSDNYRRLYSNDTLISSWSVVYGNNQDEYIKDGIEDCFYVVNTANGKMPLHQRYWISDKEVSGIVFTRHLNDLIPLLPDLNCIIMDYIIHNVR